MNQECYPYHASTNSSTRKLRLKILTSNGRRFICPVSYECTIEDLADRILKVYTQFQKDPTHRYFQDNQGIAKRVYNIRSNSYYLGKMDFVGDLLNDLDQIECDVEEMKNKDRDNNKNKEKKINKNKKRDKKKNLQQQHKQQIEVKHEKKQQIRQIIPLTSSLVNKQKIQNIKNQKIHQEETLVNSNKSPKQQFMSIQSIPPIHSSLKKNTQNNELITKSPALKPRQISSDSKISRQKQQIKPIQTSQFKKSPKFTPLEPEKIQKFNLNKDISQKVKSRQNSNVKTKQQPIKQSSNKQSLLKQTPKDNSHQIKQKTNKVDEQQGPTRRKKSCVIVQSQSDKQIETSHKTNNIYSSAYIQSNKKKIFNRFDDDDSD